MEPQRDFKELLELFNSHGVEFVIVGGYALAFHGVPRFTGDIDLLVGTSEDNARRIIAALEEFGFGNVGLETDDFSTPDRVVQLGQPPVRIDLLTTMSGVTWEQVRRNRVSGHYGEVAVSYIGRDDLVANKKACGRHQDLADLESLGEDV